MAREMLAFSASTADVERLFSRSGLTCTDLRNRMDHEHGPSIAKEVRDLVTINADTVFILLHTPYYTVLSVIVICAGFVC